jgi:AcrR family transcriptional regulator
MEDQEPGGDRGTGGARLRERIEIAMLELSGEVGYRCVTLEQLLARSGASAADFEASFADLGACFAAAYEVEADALAEEMLEAARRAGEWRSATEAALSVVLRRAAARPAIAKALVRQAHVAGGAALAKHEEVLERLSTALGEECGAPTDHFVVPRAPNFVVGAVEGVIAGHLDRDQSQELLGAAPELMDLIATFFVGGEAGDD